MDWSKVGPLYVRSSAQPCRQGSVDLYWNLSTWNPYEVVLMKSTLRLADVM